MYKIVALFVNQKKCFESNMVKPTKNKQIDEDKFDSRLFKTSNPTDVIYKDYY